MLIKFQYDGFIALLTSNRCVVFKIPEPDLDAGLNSVKCVCGTLYPFESHRRLYSTFDQNSDFKVRREHQKNFL